VKSSNQTRIFILVVCLSLASPAWANWIGGFQLDRGESAHLGHLEEASVTFDFKVTHAGGAALFVEGIYEGVLVPGLITNPSLSHPAGTERSGGNHITYIAGDVLVDQIRITMFGFSPSMVLLEMYLPVDYSFGSHAVNDIVMSYSSPSWIRHGDDLDIQFAYQTDEPGGVRISARPFTDGVLTPGYGASGSVLSPVGNGSGSQNFTFNGSSPHVDEVRFQMYNADNSILLLEFFVPVDLHWESSGFGNISMTPASPGCLAWDHPVSVEFDYASSDPSGAWVWAFALDENQDWISGQADQFTVLIPDSGHSTRQISLEPAAGQGEVAFVQLLMFDATRTDTLADIRLPVSFPFGPKGIGNISFHPSSPAVLDAGEQIDVTFTYAHDEAAGVRFTSVPFTYAGPSPGHAVSGSPLYPPTGNATQFFLLTAGDYLVDRVVTYMYDESGLIVLMSCSVDTEFTYGGAGGISAVAELPTAGGPLLGQNYPNPFNPVTSIPVDLTVAGRVAIKVYDLRGRLVRSLADEIMPPGRTVVPFDGTELASGTYLYALETERGRQARMMVLVK